MLNSSSLDTDDRWAWKRPCSFICWRWLPQVFASAFVIASFQSSNLKKEKIERHGFIHAITAHLFLTSKFKSMVKKKEKKLKVTSTGTAAASRLRLLIWMVTPSNIYQRPRFVQKMDSAIQLLNDRVQNYMTGINKKAWNCESCVLEVLLVVSSEP